MRNILCFGGILWTCLLAGCHSEPAPPPVTDDVLLQRGTEALQGGRFKEATAHLTTLLERDPRHVDALIARGQAFKRMNQHEQALADFDAAIAIDSEHAKAHRYRSEVLQLLGRPDDANAAAKLTAEVERINQAKAEAPDPRTVEKVREQFAKTPNRPLPADPNAFGHATFLQQRYDWLKSRYLDPVSANRDGNSADKTWWEPTRVFLDKAIRAAAELEPKTTIAELERLGKAAIDAGCKDPLILDVYSLVLFLAAEEDASARYHNLARQQMPTSPYRDRGEWDVYVDLGTIPIHRISHNTSHPWIKAAHDRLLQECRKSKYLPNERRWLLEFLVADYQSLLPGKYRVVGDVYKVAEVGRVDFLQRLAADEKADPWLRAMLLAQPLFAEGTQVASHTRDRAKSELERTARHKALRRALPLYLTAWDLHPEYPEAPTSLMQIVAELGGIAGEDARFWRDCALKGEFDYPPALEAWQRILSQGQNTN